MATLNGGRGWASDACAASIHRLDSAFGRILPIASAGRTYAQQAELYRLYKSGRGALALPPGQSLHESGLAIDWGNQVYSLLNLYAGLGWRGTTLNHHGHRRTVSSEVWHTEYDANRDQHRNGGGGMYAAPVAQIQDLANKLGANLAVDGDYGPKTAGWVRAFQGDHGLTVDGIVGPITWAKMKEVYAATQDPYAQYGGAAWVKAIQNKLNRLNYGPLDEDGQPGPKTQDAIKHFQQDNGLEVDGIAGPITNNKLDDRLTAAPVGRNDTSRPTVEIQNYLISKGYDLGSYGADGDYGPATTAAVIKFQKDNKISADGIWGPQTDAIAFPAGVVGRNDTDRSTWDIQRLVGAEADGVYGPRTTEKVKAWQAANGLEADGIWGPASDAKGFPETPVTSYPTNGRNATTRPTRDIQTLVGAEVDGSYGPNTSQKVAQWQEKNGLDADGIWGPASDAKGFPGVPLPDAPADPTADPTYGKKIPTYPGAEWADISPNKSVREGEVQLFVIHHAADPRDVETQRKRFMTSNDRNVSPNWLIGADGSVSEIVPPDDYRAWTGGAVDHQAVTVETQNSSGAPEWGITQESHEAIAQLVAWAADRYGFPVQKGQVTGTSKNNTVVTPGVVGHRDTPYGKETGTACPGPSMNMDWIISRAQEIYQEKYAGEPQEPSEPSIPEGMALVPIEFLQNLQANLQADAEEIGKILG